MPATGQPQRALPAQFTAAKLWRLAVNGLGNNVAGLTLRHASAMWLCPQIGKSPAFCAGPVSHCLLLVI